MCIRDSLSTRRKNSYLKIIAALCGTTGKIDPTAREATGKLKAAIEQFGFSLSEDVYKRQLAGVWSVTVSGNWRITFRFEDGNAYIVDYQDYH